jgi:16S rRNA (guanine527-N7)-methyltransferase
MKDLFLSKGLSLTEEQLKKFEKYYELLVYYNQKFNITAITEKEEVYKKHFVDSLIGVDKIKGRTLIDIGSGGGFPAIPLKIYNDSLDVTMVEATGKKCEFLREVIHQLGLQGVKVINDRAELLVKKEGMREGFDVCSARAVARLNTLLEYCLPFVKVGGRFVSYKGDAEEEIIEAENAIKVLGGKLIDTEAEELFGAKRQIVVVEKIKKTDAKYPRGNGKERKNPL